MSSDRSRGKRHWLVWGIINSLFLFSLVTPILIISFWLLSIPAVILYVKANRALFWGTIAISTAIGAVFAGTGAGQVLMLSLFSLIPAIVIGKSYRQQLSARKAITRGTVAYIAMFLVSLMAAAAFGFELAPSIDATVRESINLLPEAFRGTLADEQVDDLIRLTQQLVPLYIIGTSFLIAVLTHAIARRVLNRIGESIAGVKPAKQWSLPRALVWYYLIALIVDLIVPTNNDTFMSTIIVNVVPILMLIFAVQGISFLFFFTDLKRWGRWTPWLGILLMLVVPFLFSVFSLLGVFDTAFPLRDRLRKP